MATTAQLDLSIWRNDDVYEYPLRVIGPNLTDVGMKAQIRLERDTPGPALVALELTTNGNAEGIRLASAALVDGRWVNDVRIRLNKTTRIALPYAGEIGDAAVLRWAFAIAGRTRIDGRVLILAHALDSNGAPADRPQSFGRSIQQGTAPASGATLTINEDDGANLVIDGADMLGDIVSLASAQSTAASESADRAEAAARLSLGDGSRQITVGAPKGVLTATTTVADIGTWWNEAPTLQGGLAIGLYGSFSGVGTVTYHLAKRGADGSFVKQHSATVSVPSAGTFSVASGDLFPSFPVEPGWYVGLEQTAGVTILALNGLGNCLYQAVGGALVYVRGKTPAFGVEITAPALPISATEMKRKRTLIWNEDLATAVPPIGWDTDATAIVYGADGLTIGAGVPPGWAIRVYTNRYIRTDERVTEVEFTCTGSGDRLGIVTGQPSSAQFLDAGNSNSAIEINGATNTLAIKNSGGIGNGSGGDPGNVVSGPIGFSLTAGRRYRAIWTRDGFVHGVTLIDMTTGARSPTLTSGDPDFVGTPGTGVDTPEGFQNGALGFIFISGRPKINSVSVYHDGVSPTLYVEADSIGAQVYLPREDGWVGQIRAKSVPVLLSAQPGGSTYGGTFAAAWQLPAARPRVAINATGVNDVLLGFNVANSRWMLASFIDLAARVGAVPVLTVLAPLPGRDVGPFNAMVQALAASRPGTKLLRYDKALTVNGNGTTPDTAKLFADLTHPRQIGADAIAIFAELNVPEMLG